MHIACRKGYNEIAVALIERGADIHVKDNVSQLQIYLFMYIWFISIIIIITTFTNPTLLLK